MANWGNMAQIVSTASATLMGLLFVAIQLNRDWIIKYPSIRGRATETLLVFALALIVSILLAIPGQSVRQLGVELLVMGIIYGFAVLAINTNRKQGDSIASLDRRLRHTPAVSSAVLTLISGSMLAAGLASGLYWLLATMILALVGGIT